MFFGPMSWELGGESEKALEHTVNSEAIRPSIPVAHGGHRVGAEVERGNVDSERRSRRLDSKLQIG